MNYIPLGILRYDSDPSLFQCVMHGRMCAAQGPTLHPILMGMLTAKGPTSRLEEMNYLYCLYFCKKEALRKFTYFILMVRVRVT